MLILSNLKTKISGISFKSYRTAVSLFAFLSALIIAFTLVLSSQRQGLFEDSLSVSIVTSSSNGLVPGVPVNMSGVRIGSLKSVALLEDGSVKIDIRVRERYKSMVSSSSEALLFSSSFFGTGSISLTPSANSREELSDDIVIQGTLAPSFESILSSLQSASSDLSELINSIDDIADIHIPVALEPVSTVLGSAQRTIDLLNADYPILLDALRSSLETTSQAGVSIDLASDEVAETLRSVRPDLIRSVSLLSTFAVKINDILDQLSFLLEPAVSSVSPVNESAPLTDSLEGK